MRIIMFKIRFSMRHCLIMTAYKDAEMINSIIDETPVSWGVYIHIDAKSSLLSSMINNRAIVIKKYRIYWGGIEHLYAFIELMSMALNSGENYDYYHLITGQDYYAIPPLQFDTILGGDGMNYLDIFPLPRQGWWGDDLDILRYRTFSSRTDIRKGIYRKLDSLWRITQKMLGLQRSLPSYSIYGGSVYCSLTKNAVNEVVNGETSEDLLQRLKNTTCGEEVYFQTILMNSNLRDTIFNNQLRYIDWNVKNAPGVLIDEDFDKIVKGKALFCRKLDSTVSKSLLIKLKKYMSDFSVR